MFGKMGNLRCVKVWFHAFSVKCNQAEGSLIPGDPGVPGDQRGSQCTPNSPCPHKKNCLLIDISSDLPTPNILFSRSSQHFLSNFSLLPIVYLPPQWGDLLILFNRNNCSLSVGVFSSSLICESIAVQFLTFVPHEEQTLVEKDSPSLRTTKSSFFSRSAHFGNVSPFLVGATNTFSELIHPLVKLPNCVLKQQPHILQFIRSAWHFCLSLSSGSRHRLCCHTAPSTHFWSYTMYTTFHYIQYTGKLELFTDFTKVDEISVKCLDFLCKLQTL